MSPVRSVLADRPGLGTAALFGVVVACGAAVLASGPRHHALSAADLRAPISVAAASLAPPVVVNTIGSVPPSVAPVVVAPPRPTISQVLPTGGTRILPKYRVVAFYGGPGGPGLGILGAGTPEQAAVAVSAQAARFARYGRPVLPAMELIATVAQGGPGPDGRYSLPIPDATIASYLAAAHRHHMLLILDFQPGRGDFLPQVIADSHFLTDPSVSVGLDPEWKVSPGEVPGDVIGSSDAADINAVARLLSAIVRTDHLPDKLLLIHQFQLAMLPDRAKITEQPGVEVVFHADGFGGQQTKIAVYHQLAFPGPPFGIGFKLFVTRDSDMMTPAQAMALVPRPDVITYE